MSVLAADIGGGSIRAARVSDQGEIEDRRSAETPKTAAKCLALLGDLWQALDTDGRRAVAVAGGIDARTGEVTRSPNLPWLEGTHPGTELHCRVLNDANAALLGEAWVGALEGKNSAVLLTLGTGVGGGLLIDGRLWTGATGCAGEIGHTPVDRNGPPCLCGSRGCLELYASATAVARHADAADGKQAAARARDGDERAIEAFRRAGEALGIVLAGIANTVNPEAICIAGGLSPALDLMEPALRNELTRRAFPLATRDLAVLPAQLGGDAGLLGAARAALIDERRNRDGNHGSDPNPAQHQDLRPRL